MSSSRDITGDISGAGVPLSASFIYSETVENCKLPPDLIKGSEETELRLLMQIWKIWKFLFGTVCVYLEFLSVLYLTLKWEDVLWRLLCGEDSEDEAGGDYQSKPDVILQTQLLKLGGWCTTRVLRCHSCLCLTLVY